MTEETRGRKKKDFVGKRFGKLLVLSRNSPPESTYVKWNCVCDCGRKSIVSASNLSSGNTASCGCSRKEKRGTRAYHKKPKPIPVTKTLYWDPRNKEDFIAQNS